MVILSLGFVRKFYEADLSDEFMQGISVVYVLTGSYSDDKSDFIVSCAILVGLGENPRLEQHEVVYGYVEVK